MTIYLIKQGIDANRIVKAGITCQAVEGYTLYYKATASNPPKWTRTFFENKVDGLHFKSSVPSALLIVPHLGRIFAIPFGTGFTFLENDVVENNFGIITALNIIDPQSIRTVDIDQVDDNPTKSRTQISRISSIDDFRLDLDRILMKSITGKVKDIDQQKYGKTITGGQSLHVNAPDIKISNVTTLLGNCFSAYNNGIINNAEFSWINNLKEIKDKALLNRLNDELINDVNSANHSWTFYFSAPEVVDWTEIDCYRFNRKTLPLGVDLITDIFPNMGNGQHINLEGLKKQRITAQRSDGSDYRVWNVYNCIYTEKHEANAVFILNSGVWFQVNSNFCNDLDIFYDHVDIYNDNMPQLKKERRPIRGKDTDTHETEGTYNDRLSRDEGYEKGDKNLVKLSSKQTPIEVCDLYKIGNGRHLFFHVKLGNSSATLSHLFNQGLISGELLLEKDFRTKANQKIPSIITANMVNQFKAQDAEIIFVVISNQVDANNHPDIPFFSKIAFRHVHSTLTKFGYRVKIKSVGME